MCPVTALRVAYTGELGWELHHPIEMQNYLFDRLMEAGEPHGPEARRRPRPELAAPGEVLPRLRHRARPRRHRCSRPTCPASSTSPRTSTARPRWRPPRIRSKCVTLLIDGPADADPWGREALYDGDTRVGRLTSGGWSVAFGKSIGMGYVTPRPRDGRHPAPGPDAGPPLARRDRRGQPLRPGERPHPRRRLTAKSRPPRRKAARSVRATRKA